MHSAALRMGRRGAAPHAAELHGAGRAHLNQTRATCAKQVTAQYEGMATSLEAALGQACLHFAADDWINVSRHLATTFAAIQQHRRLTGKRTPWPPNGLLSTTRRPCLRVTGEAGQGGGLDAQALAMSV